MILKYDTYIKNDAIEANLKKLTNQIYKLLPTWEEGTDWHKPLATIVEEVAGMDELFLDHHKILFPLLCKLEGLIIYSKEEDFFDFRRTIFECIGYVSELIKICQ
jgi:hypothetical protein